MSYDLFFTGRVLSRQEFAAYFSRRPRYRLENDQAWYESEDTGVYFSFDLTPGPAEDPEAPRSSASFNLNYFRPHFFGLEAEPEVRGFVDHFGFQVIDPQREGMGEGDYSSEGFLRGWNLGNEFGYRSIFSAEDAPECVPSRRTEELESIWRWNLRKDEHQSRFGEEVFVPGIMFVQLGAELQSVVVWPDAIPTLIPLVDSLVIPRKDLAPRSLFRKGEDLCLVPFDQVRQVIESFAQSGYPRPAYCLRYEAAPADVLAFVRQLEPHTGSLAGVPMDRVLNRELVEQSRPG